MSYNFNDIIEFQEFLSDSFERGDYTQEIENFNKGINTISNHKRRWDWVEGEKLYLGKNPAGQLFIIYQHPLEGFEQYLWFWSVVNLGKNRYSDTWDMGTQLTPDGDVIERDIYDDFAEKSSSTYDPLGGVSWVKEYMVLDSHSLTFLNWINENPFEVKQ